MKKILNFNFFTFRGLGGLCLFSLLLVFASCAKEKAGGEYTITMDLKVFKENGIQLDSILLRDADGKTLQSIKEINDYKVSMKGQTEGSEMATVVGAFSMNGETQITQANLVLEPGNIEFNTDLGYFKGTPLNDSVCNYVSKLYAAYENDGDFDALATNFFKYHSNDACALVILTDQGLINAVSDETLSAIVEKLPQETKDKPVMKEVLDKLAKKEVSAVGKNFIDFEAEYDGKVQKLSDYVGKGKYVLVDFWASWCGPCRKEVPNIIKVYNKYKGDRFEALGVATWDDPAATLEAIKEEGIEYPQMLNAQNAGSDAYGIDGIPEIILFGPDGTIIKRGLRGDDIEKAVAEALGE